jgi:hypothetical protein
MDIHVYSDFEYIEGYEENIQSVENVALLIAYSSGVKLRFRNVHTKVDHDYEGSSPVEDLAFIHGAHLDGHTCDN